MNKRTLITLVLLFSFTNEITSISINEPQHFHLRSQTQNHERTTMSKSGSSGGSTFAGFIVGPILFIMSFIMIWHNQRKASIDYRRLRLAQSMVHEVNPFVQQQIYQADGKLVHIVGDSITNEPVYQNLAAITLSNTIKIQRVVQVKEYRARQRKQGDNQIVQYDLLWVTSNSPNQRGRHNSPEAWFIRSQTSKTRQVYIGNYTLSETQIDQLQCQHQFSPTMMNAQSIQQRTQRFDMQPQVQGNYIYFPSHNGGTEGHGSLRVKFAYCENGPISLISLSNKNTFVPFRIDVQDNGGTEDPQENVSCAFCFLSSCVKSCFKPITDIDYIRQEKLSYKEIIEEQVKNHKCRTNGFRIGTYFLMVIGICIFFSPITAILGYIPLVGGLLKSAVGIAIFLAALIICIPLYLLTFSIAWLFYHPKIGIPLLILSLAIAGLIIGLSASRSKESNAPEHTLILHSLTALRTLNFQ